MQSNGQPPTKKKPFKTWLLNWFGLTDEITVKLYHGYGHKQNLVIYGHVFKLAPLPQSKYKKSILHNSIALLRLFMVKPYPYIPVQLLWKDLVLTTKTSRDGFFKFEWKDASADFGWHIATASVRVPETITGEGAVYVTHPTQYGFISDIDDTFLISYSGNLRKRLWVLFTENARSRKPFESVIRHYELLTKSNTTPDAPNPFFYVSSSEWNLYDYLLEFTTINGIPRGIFLLNVVKTLTGIFKTGQNNHSSKFVRIARILESYPDQQFVLLGDSSQQDPYIYASLVKHFGNQIKAVYIRDVSKKNHEKVADVLQEIERAGVPCCFFAHSSEAIAHSKKIGLITKPLQE